MVLTTIDKALFICLLILEELVLNVRLPETMLSGPWINDGTPIPATIAFKLPLEDAWIVGVNEGGYLRMVKLKVTGSNSFKWIATKHNRVGNYDESCLTAFSESCFVGTDSNEDQYKVQLVASDQGKHIVFITNIG